MLQLPRFSQVIVFFAPKCQFLCFTIKRINKPSDITLHFVYRTRLGADVGKAAADREFKGLFDCIIKCYKVPLVSSSFFRKLIITNYKENDGEVYTFEFGKRSLALIRKSFLMKYRQSYGWYLCFYFMIQTLMHVILFISEFI